MVTAILYFSQRRILLYLVKPLIPVLRGSSNPPFNDGSHLGPVSSKAENTSDQFTFQTKKNKSVHPFQSSKPQTDTQGQTRQTYKTQSFCVGVIPNKKKCIRENKQQKIGLYIVLFFLIKQLFYEMLTINYYNIV